MVAWLAVQAGVSVGALAGQWVYHRWFAEQDIVKKPKPQEVSIPRVDEGSPISLFYGRCRVRQPILAWHGVPQVSAGAGLYTLDMYMVIGIGFADGSAASTGFHRAWWGDKQITVDVTAAGSALAVIEVTDSYTTSDYVGNVYQWYDGNASQVHVDAAGTAITEAGARMLYYWPKESIPAYRGVASVMLCGTNLTNHFFVGNTVNVPQISFEMSSYHYAADYPCQTLAYARIGNDANPIQVLYDVLICKFGKLGIPSTLIDMTSFRAAAITLTAEQHGYSREISDVRDGSDLIMEIQRQTDSVIYEDPADGLIKIRLIRNDYNPAAIRQITKSNCVDITNFAMSSPSGIPNAVRIQYTDAASDYQDATEVAKNAANAVGQSDQVRWLVKQFPGVTTSTLAHRIAVRELAAEGRCIIKCRALVDRSFYDITPGEPVRLFWTGPDIAGICFRVASVDRGTLEDGKIALDLISDHFAPTSPSRPPRSLPIPHRKGDPRLD